MNDPIRAREVLRQVDSKSRAALAHEYWLQVEGLEQRVLMGQPVARAFQHRADGWADIGRRLGHHCDPIRSRSLKIEQEQH